MKEQVEKIIRDKSLTTAQRIKLLLALIIDPESTHGGGDGEGGKSIEISSPEFLDPDVDMSAPEAGGAGSGEGEDPTDDYTTGFCYGILFARETFDHKGYVHPMKYEVELPEVPEMIVL